MIFVENIKIDNPCSICIAISLPENSEARIRCVDLQSDNVFFDRRTGNYSGNITFEQGINFPCAKYLGLQIQNIKEKKIQINNIYTKQLNVLPYNFTDAQKKFVEFAKQFVCKLNYLPNGVYESEDSTYYIVLDEFVTNLETGEIINTPARVNRSKGYIYVSKAYFKNCTLPMMMFILLHEYVHHIFEYTKPYWAEDELKVDLEAAKMYASLGLPKLEAIYALTKLFQTKINNLDELIYSNYVGKPNSLKENRIIQLKKFFLTY